MRLFNFQKKISCMFFSFIIFCLSAFPVFAETSVEVISTTEISASEDNWWDRGVQYGRLLVLNNQSREEDNVILATHCELNAGLTDNAPGYPIYRSHDNGNTWSIISRVSDTLTGASSEWNPTLFELSKPCGSFPAGTVILVACSIDAEHKKESHICLYFSLDGGYTFEQGAVIASAGGLDNGVWEPFLIQLDDGSLVCYYSDDSDSRHSQTIVYKQSKDAENWDEAVTVTASEIYKERPGMPVVTRIADGSYFMVYEVVDKDGVSGNPIYFKRSADGLDWGDASLIGEELISVNGKKALGSAPYCGWTAVGGENGTLIVSGSHMRKGKSKTGSDYFISYDNGKTWETAPHIIPYIADDHVGYSNSFAFSEDGKTMYSINNPQKDTNTDKSKMVVAVAKLQEAPHTKQISPVIISIILISAFAVAAAILITVLKKKKV